MDGLAFPCVGDDVEFNVFKPLQVIEDGARVDLIVTDHLMPGMSGTDLASEVCDRRPDLPVLVVSGYAELDGIASGLPRLTKPFRKDKLAASLAALRRA